MTTINYDLNRPFHLGRRDVFFEKSIESFKRYPADRSKQKRLTLIDTILHLLQSASEHATLAAKSMHTYQLEESFILFIRMVLFYLYSARAVIDYESRLQNTKSPFSQFFNRKGQTNSQVVFARGSGQLLEDVARLLDLAKEPYRDLQRNVLRTMNKEQRSQYKTAYADLKRHLKSSAHEHHMVTYARTFYPVLEKKYG